MNNPLLIHIYFESKVTELMDRYKNESVKNDTSNGFRDLTWSKYKRDTLVPLLLKIFEKRQLVNASSAYEYEQEFRGAILNFLDYCDNERENYNNKNSKSLGQGELETEYLDRILKMIEHLQGLYEVFYIDKTVKHNIVGTGNEIAFDREKIVQGVFSTLYIQEKMSKQDYQYIDDLVQCLKEKQELFEQEFEEALNKMKETKGATDNKEGIQAFKDSKYNSELDTALKTFIQSRYQAATERSQTTPTAIIKNLVDTTWNWGGWLLNDAVGAAQGLGANVLETILDRWVPTQGPTSTTINSTNSVGVVYRPTVSTASKDDDKSLTTKAKDSNTNSSITSQVEL